MRILTLGLLFLLHGVGGAWAAPFRIEVVEKGSRWPVPLVELRTTGEVRFVTDNAGLVAFDLPECMGRETWFSVNSPGYDIPADGLGSRGFRCTPTPGGKYTLEIPRNSAARRLGRLTGAGLFGESQKLGERLDWKESGVVGSDTVLVSPYRDRLFWFWGDTGVSGYPLGIFNASGATSTLRPLATFQPPLAVPYEYFRRPDGQPRGVLDLKGSGPFWITACATLPDTERREHLVCTYTKIENHVEATEIGLAEWDDAAAMMRPIHTLWTKQEGKPKPLHPVGHPAFWQDPAGKRWLYFGEGLPNFRCPAAYEDWKNPAKWEEISRPPHLVVKDGGKREEIAVATGSVAWNAWRKRWVTVFQQKFGRPSVFGEVWYAEGDSPAGPWGRPVKVLSHQNYTFYNPVLHAELTPTDSPILLFEGTYTAEFADHPVPTPKYNYNQILYRLDLDDPALTPARSAPEP